MPRTSRKSSAPTPAVSTPASSSSRARPPSPLSPHRISRGEEKEEMRGLNNRLAQYIDMVQTLQRDNNCLQEQMTTIEESKSSEITKIVGNYDAEMAKLRKALDDTSKERAMFEMEADKLGKENRDMKTRLKDKERAYDQAAKELRNLQTMYAKVDSENNNAQSELADLRPNVHRLETKLADAKRNLEDETLKRVDLQNQLQSSKESMQFNNDVLQQQLEETRTRRQIEMSEIDGRLSQEYEDRYSKNLEELRTGYDQKLKGLKEEMAHNYESKIKNLSEKLQDARTSGAGSLQELREYETRMNGLTSRNVELEASNASLQKRVKDLMEAMDDAAVKYRADLAKKDAEVQNFEERLDEQTKEYEALLETKIALDAEIATYNKLLSGEEVRLGTSPAMMSSSRRSMAGSTSVQTPPARGVKRKRTNIMEEEEVTSLVVEGTSDGDIVIEPLTVDSKCVAIRNRSDKEINIGGWTLSNKTDDEEAASYKFHRSTTLQPDDVCRVFSSDSAEVHTPPLNLVMKRGGWTIGERNETVLTRKDDSEVASCVTRKERSLSQSVRQGYSFSAPAAAGESADKNCVIM